eukprot:2683376-Lingulodinium_polyedra.AAC.1
MPSVASSEWKLLRRSAGWSPASSRGPGVGLDEHVIRQMLAPRAADSPVVPPVTSNGDEVNGAAGSRATISVLSNVEKNE